MRKTLINNLTSPLLFLTFLALFCAVFAGCQSAGTVHAKVQTSFLLDTSVSVTYYDTNDAKTIQEALKYCRELELIFSRKEEEAELFKVNQKAGEKVEISKELYTCLKKAKEMADYTEGAFDFTLGGVSDLYQFTGKEHFVPEENVLQEALSHTGPEKVLLSSEGLHYYVQVTDPALVLDLGGIAKGYIGDRLKSYMEARGVKNAIINLGGNVLLIGQKPLKQNLLGNYTDYSDYTVGIQYPEANSSKVIRNLSLQNTSCVTAGVYQRYFEQDGILYHHILNPETGKPVQNDLLSVTVVGEESALSDALSTSCMVLGLEKGKAFLLENYPDYTGYFITSDYQIH